MKPLYPLIVAVCLSGCMYSPPGPVPDKTEPPAAKVSSSADQKAFYSMFAKAVRKGNWNDTDTLMAAFKEARELGDIPSDPALMRITFPEFAKSQPIDPTLRESIAARFDKLGK